MNDDLRSSTRFVLRNVRIAYALGLYQAKAFETGQQPKYGCTCLIPPGHPALELIEPALIAAAEAKWGPRKNWARNLKGLSVSPVLKSVAEFEKLQTGDITENWSFVRISSLDQPGIVDANVEEIPASDLQRECYSGRWAHVSCNAYGYERVTGNGVTLGLNSVQLLRHDKRLGAGRPRPEEDFDPEEVDDADDNGEDEDEEFSRRRRHRSTRR